MATERKLVQISIHRGYVVIEDGNPFVPFDEQSRLCILEMEIVESPDLPTGEFHNLVFARSEYSEIEE